VAARLAHAVDAVERGVLFVVQHEPADPALVGTAAVSLLLAFGTLLGGWHLAREAWATAAGDEDRAWLDGRRALASFYAEHLLPRIDAHVSVVRAGSASVMRFPEDLL
jgi:hypothetical protein